MNIGLVSTVSSTEDSVAVCVMVAGMRLTVRCASRTHIGTVTVTAPVTQAGEGRDVRTGLKTAGLLAIPALDPTKTSVTTV